MRWYKKIIKKLELKIAKSIFYGLKNKRMIKESKQFGDIINVNEFKNNSRNAGNADSYNQIVRRYNG